MKLNCFKLLGLVAIFALATNLHATTYVVTNTNPTGPNSLRRAIIDSNGNTAQPNIIEFNIPGTAPYVINLNSNLPAITQSVTIDGTSQPSYVNDPVVILNGDGTPTEGLNVQAEDCVIKGLEIRNFVNAGIIAADTTNLAHNLKIEKNFIHDNGHGPNSGQAQAGIHTNSATNLLINKNHIKDNDFSTDEITNTHGGIVILKTSNSTVSNNLVEDNGKSPTKFTLQGGIVFEDSSLSEIFKNTVTDNGQGTSTGNNSMSGIMIARGNLIKVYGNTVEDNANTSLTGTGQNISQNGITAIASDSVEITDNEVRRNGNGAGFSVPLIMPLGMTIAQQKLRQALNGLTAQGGVNLVGSSNNFVSGNLVENNGTGNGSGYHAGILLTGTPFPVARSSSGNSISDNDVRHNGTGNGNGAGIFGGVLIVFGSKNLVDLNRIHNNGTQTGEFSAGVLIDGVAKEYEVSGSSILRNSITANYTKGIELINMANNDQTAPELLDAILSQDFSKLQINGTMNGPTGESYRLEFFSNPADFPNQGKTYLGELLVQTQSPVDFSVTFDVSVPVGNTITATATTVLSGDTSEFSNSVATVTSSAPIVQNETYEINENSALINQLQASSPDNLSLDYTIVSGPSDGTLCVNFITGDFVYQPNQNFSGTDNFTFRVTDSLGNSSIGEIRIIVQAIPVPPIPPVPRLQSAISRAVKDKYCNNN